jgi:hypothetical protein
LLEKSSDVHNLHPLIKLVEATAGAAPAGTGLAAARFLGSLMTNEKLAESVVGMLRSGVGPGAAAQVVPAFKRSSAALARAGTIRSIYTIPAAELSFRIRQINVYGDD